MPPKQTKAKQTKAKPAPAAPTADDTAVPVTAGDAEQLDGLDAPIEYVDPEPDEEGEGGDIVQLVRTGWVRFFIGGHGRVRFRPPRFGELRRILTADEEMVDLIQQEVHRTTVATEELTAASRQMDADDLSPEARHAEIVRIQAEDRRLTREFRRFQEDQHIALWQMIHSGDGEWKGLGVGGESLPDHDDLPMWITQAPLVQLCVADWKAVPLALGRR